MSKNTTVRFGAEYSDVTTALHEMGAGVKEFGHEFRRTEFLGKDFSKMLSGLGEEAGSLGSTFGQLAGGLAIGGPMGLAVSAVVGLAEAFKHLKEEAKEAAKVAAEEARHISQVLKQVSDDFHRQTFIASGGDAAIYDTYHRRDKTKEELEKKIEETSTAINKLKTERDSFNSVSDSMDDSSVLITQEKNVAAVDAKIKALTNSLSALKEAQAQVNTASRLQLEGVVDKQEAAGQKEESRKKEEELRKVQEEQRKAIAQHNADLARVRRQEETEIKTADQKRLAEEKTINSELASAEDKRVVQEMDNEISIARVTNDKKFEEKLKLEKKLLELDQQYNRQKKSLDESSLFGADYDQASKQLLQSHQSDITSVQTSYNTQSANDKISAELADRKNAQDALTTSIQESGQSAQQFGQIMGQALYAMASGQETVLQGMTSMLAQIAQMITAKMIEAEITIAVAAAEAAGSQAAIPIVGPVLAIAAAGTVFSALMGYVAHAEGGWDIPAGGPFPMVAHEKEMVLPQQYAERIRNMTDQHSQMGNVNVTIHAVDSQSVEQLFNEHQGTLIRTIQSAAYSGRF